METIEFQNLLRKKVQPHLDMIPEHMRQPVLDYLLRGFGPGSFLFAVLSNDFKGAVARADHINIEKLVDWANFITWAIPSKAHGSPEAVVEWMRLAQNGFEHPKDSPDSDHS